jgi:hypothetical protein
MSTKPVRGCFDNLEGMNNGDFPSWHGSRIHELANGMRHGTTMPSQDLSEDWIIMCGCEPARASTSP